jgi:hypothetical protein
MPSLEGCGRVAIGKITFGKRLKAEEEYFREPLE